MTLKSQVELLPESIRLSCVKDFFVRLFKPREYLKRKQLYEDLRVRAAVIDAAQVELEAIGTDMLKAGLTYGKSAFARKVIMMGQHVLKNANRIRGEL